MFFSSAGGAFLVYVEDFVVGFHEGFIRPTCVLYIFEFFSHATLNETFTAKYDGVLPRTPQVRPKSEIYTPKWDDEHPHSISQQ